MRNKLLALTTLSSFLFCGTSQASLLLYEPFDYTAGERLGGSGTSPLGKVAPNGQQWITRSPAAGGTYDPARDVLITPGSLSYVGLTASSGNSVRYGSSVDNGAGLYTAAIGLPTSVTSGSLYYSMLVRLHGPVNPLTSARTSYASLSSETANPGTDAGLGLSTASGTTTPLPASAWIRNVSGVNYQLGSGKSNVDGMGPGVSAPSWQSSAAGHPYPNQNGNTAGTGQDWAGISDDLYFIVMKYTFAPEGDGNDDTVSMWVNPIASTLGVDAGEATAGAAGGSYYSAINATVAGIFDVNQIESFLLIGQAVASAASARSIDTSLDELRIGTTWADVTPVPEPGMLAFLAMGFAAMLWSRRHV